MYNQPPVASSTRHNFGFWVGARSLDEAARELVRHLYTLARNQGLGDGARVADVGCGSGESCRDFLEQGARSVVGVTPNRFEHARLAAIAARESRITAVHTDALCFARRLAQGTIDAAFFVDCAYHFAPSRFAMLGPLRDAGVPLVVLADIVRAPADDPWTRAVQAVLCTVVLPVLFRIPRANLVTTTEYAELCGLHGFTVVDVEDVTGTVWVEGFIPWARGRQEKTLRFVAAVLDWLVRWRVLRYITVVARAS